MQRKNHILVSLQHKRQRSGMAMIMALAVIVILATIMALSLSFTAETSKRTTDIYLYEQAVLVSKSAAELALLSIAQSGHCLLPDDNATDYIGTYQFDLNNNGDLTDDINYTVSVIPRYVYKGSPCASTDDDYTTVNTEEQNGSVLMDITVTTTEGTEPIRYFRRSIQKL
mgnify:CR=1 FL=1